jgi:two-component system cell cycle response regulator DivK
VAGELILIVEDNDENLELVRDLLQFKGYRTLDAGTAAAGIALAAAHHPDLVLMDIQLPDDSGIAALAHLRALPGGTTIAVVAFTAFAMREDQAQLLGAGFDGYLAKPIEIHAFLHQVRQFCAHEA